MRISDFQNKLGESANFGPRYAGPFAQNPHYTVIEGKGFQQGHGIIAENYCPLADTFLSNGTQSARVVTLPTGGNSNVYFGGEKGSWLFWNPLFDKWEHPIDEGQAAGSGDQSHAAPNLKDRSASQVGNNPLLTHYPNRNCADGFLYTPDGPVPVSREAMQKYWHQNADMIRPKPCVLNRKDSFLYHGPSIGTLSANTTILDPTQTEVGIRNSIRTSELWTSELEQRYMKAMYFEKFNAADAHVDLFGDSELTFDHIATFDTLRMPIELRNHETSRSALANFGFHSFFYCPGDGWTLETEDISKRWEMHEGLPTGNFTDQTAEDDPRFQFSQGPIEFKLGDAHASAGQVMLDHGFVLSDSAPDTATFILKNESLGFGYKIEFPRSLVNHVVMFRRRNSPYIAIEPYSSMTDAYTLAFKESGAAVKEATPLVLDPEEVRRGEIKVTKLFLTGAAPIAAQAASASGSISPLIGLAKDADKYSLHNTNDAIRKIVRMNS